MRLRILLIFVLLSFVACNGGEYFSVEKGSVVTQPAHVCAPVTKTSLPATGTALSLIFGTQNLGNSHSAWPAFASSNKLVAFGSIAADLVSIPLTPTQQAFYYDFDSLSIKLASSDENGTVSNGNSWMAKSDCTGRYIAFVSRGTNLTSEVVPGTYYHTFLKDTQTDEVKLISATAAGVPADSTSGWDAIFPTVSYDGRYVGFSSLSSNLVTPAPPAGIRQIYRKDLQTGEVILISSNEAGAGATAHIGYFDMSPDGNLFSFGANQAVFPDANGVAQVYVKNVSANTLRTVSKFNGTPGNAGSGTGNFSTDGRYLGMYSYATNLTSDAGFAHGPAGNSIFRVRLSDWSLEYVAPGTSSCCDRAPILSHDGNILVWLSNQPVNSESIGQSQATVKNMTTGEIKLVSRTSGGDLINVRAEIPTISGDGKYVVFQGLSNNTYPGDPNIGVWQAYFNLTGF